MDITIWIANIEVWGLGGLHRKTCIGFITLGHVPGSKATICGPEQNILHKHHTASVHEVFVNNYDNGDHRHPLHQYNIVNLF